MNLQNNILESLNYEKDKIENLIKKENYEHELKSEKLQNKHNFWFRFIKGVINALDKLLEGNDKRYNKEIQNLTASHNETLIILENRYNNAKSLIAKIEKDS